MSSLAFVKFQKTLAKDFLIEFTKGFQGEEFLPEDAKLTERLHETRPEFGVRCVGSTDGGVISVQKPFIRGHLFAGPLCLMGHFV